MSNFKDDLQNLRNRKQAERNALVEKVFSEENLTTEELTILPGPGQILVLVPFVEQLGGIVLDETTIKSFQKQVFLEVAAVAPRVEDFNVGDRVFAGRVSNIDQHFIPVIYKKEDKKYNVAALSPGMVTAYYPR